MTPEERAAHCRAIAAKGGQATFERYGSTHMSAIGKEGFRIAIELGWGDWLWQTVFSLTYEARFGHKHLISVTTAQMEEIRRLRAQARRRYHDLGTCAWPGCTRPATQRHHEKGVKAADANEHVTGYCAEHHRATERGKRQAHRVTRHKGKDVA